MRDVKGYKAFNKDKTNRYGLSFSEGINYSVDGEVSFGNQGNGFHMCTHLSDVFRYFDAVNDEVVVAKVVGRGDRVRCDDEYYGYYDMYVCREMYIEKFMSREEVIEKMLNAGDFDVKKFVQTFSLTDEEKIRFIRKFRSNISVIEHILYYQFGVEDIFREPKVDEALQRIRLVKKDGQNRSKGC